MDFKKIFGLKKEDVSSNGITSFEDTKISGLSSHNIQTKEDDDELNSHFDKLSELDELSKQDDVFKGVTEIDIGDIDLGLDPITQKLTSNNKGNFTSLKQKISRKKGSILSDDSGISPKNDDDIGIPLSSFDSATTPLKFNTESPKIEDNKFDDVSLNKIFGVLDEEDKNPSLNYNTISDNQNKEEVIKNTVKPNNDFTKNKDDENDNVLITDSLKNLDVKSHTQSSDIFSEGLIGLQKKLPFIGKYSTNKQYQIAGLLVVVSFISIIFGGFLYGNSSTKENKVIQFTTEFSSDVQKINSFFKEASLGKNQSYDNLSKVTAKAKADFEIIKQQSGLIKNNNLLAIQNKMQDNLYKINANVEALNSQSEILMNSADKVSDFTKSTNLISSEIDSFINLYTQQSLNQNELSSVYSLKTNLQAVNGTLATILLSDRIDPKLIESLNKARKDFKNSLLALQVGEPSRGINAITSSVLLESYQAVARDWLQLSTKADAIVNKSNELIEARELAPKNEQLILLLDKNINDMLSLYRSDDLTGGLIAKLTIFIGILLLVLAIYITFNIYSFEKDNRSLFEKIENSKNQSSILKLLNEMMPLQYGDLTKKTTVTEEITGAIADSINATIDSLASLVKKIKDTSLVMREKTNDVNLIALEMLDTTTNQAYSLNETGSSVIEIANAITEISTKTEKGAEEARKSVKVSEEGAVQVQNSVKSMRAININMNETVYLMQKVNDSSTQISSIIELLSDITEETSILALNATVQAAKAGEAGKGFKIVADSIQELADKASDAARRVGALISAVQTDIHAVEQAVQKTTEEVDNGVQLSELAGISLNKMTVVSKDLSEIVGLISEDAKSHANAAKKISESMIEILKTTQENKKSTEKTASSISEISEISNELGESVQSFITEK